MIQALRDIDISALAGSNCPQRARFAVWAAASGAAVFALLALLAPWYVPAIALTLLLNFFLILRWPALSILPIGIFYGIFNTRITLAGEDKIVDIFTISDIFMLNAFLALMLAKILRKQPLNRPIAITVPLALFVGFALMTTLWGESSYYALFGAARILISLMTFYLFRSIIYSKEQITLFGWTIVFGGILAGIGGYLSTDSSMEYFKINGMIGEGPLMYYFSFLKSPMGERAGGVGSATLLSFCMNIGLFISVALLIVEKSTLKRIFLCAAIVFFTLVNILTMSKGGLGALIIAATVYLLMMPSIRYYGIRAWFLSIVLFVVTLIFVIMVVRSGDSGKLGKDPTATSDKSSLGTRLVLWEQGFNELMRTKGLGVGLGGIVQYIEPSNIHSSYFTVLFELGLVGCVVFAWLALVLIRDVFERIRRCSDFYYQTMLCSIAGALATFLIHTSIEFDIYLKLPWMLFGLFYGVSELYERTNRDNVQGAQ